MKRTLLSGFLIAALMIGQTIWAGPLSAQATTSTSAVLVPFFGGPFGGACPDVVTVTGNILFVTHVTINGSGQAHEEINNYLVNVSGTGLSTGAEYRVTGRFQQIANIDAFDPLPAEFTNEASLNLISEGPLPNSVLHIISHITINGNGEVSAVVTKVVMDCLPS